MNSMQWLEMFVSLTMQSTLVIAAAYGLTLLCATQQARCRIWTACMAALLALAVGGVMLPHLRPIYPWAAIDTRTGAALLECGRFFGQLVLIVWLFGAGALLLHAVARWCRLSRFLRSCEEIASSEYAAEFLAPLMHRGQRIKAVISDDVQTPSCWQFQRPFVVLPRYFLGLDQSHQEFILRHELAHLRLGHPLQLFLQRILEIVFWFHPVVWWASRQAATAREFACDEASVSDNADCADYLRTLMLIVERLQSAQRGPDLLTFGERTSIMTLRVRRLVQLVKAPSPARTVQGPTSCLLAGVVLLTLCVGLIRAPIDLQASPRNRWSPWPHWTAQVLHDFGVEARDYEGHECRFDSLDKVVDRGSPAKR